MENYSDAELKVSENNRFFSDKIEFLLVSFQSQCHK